jgi:hypothetical protein
MSKFRGLRALPETIELDTEDGEIEVTIHPLKNKELVEATALFQKDVMSAKGQAKLILLTLQKDDPTVTEEEIAEFPASAIMDIMMAIMRVNKMDKYMQVDKKKLDSDPVISRLQQIQSLKESIEKTR